MLAYSWAMCGPYTLYQEKAYIVSIRFTSTEFAIRSTHVDINIQILDINRPMGSKSNAIHANQSLQSSAYIQ